MKGLDEAELFFREELYPRFQEQAPELLEQAAFGLVGAGSECLGFDDGYSRDHDFTPLCCIWIKREDWEMAAGRAKRILSQLPGEWKGMPLIPQGGLTPGRRGVLELESFYYGFLGCEGLPETTEKWLRPPEAYLACSVNGRVFWDQEGSFTRMRQGLLGYYPENIRLHRMAFCCTKIAQAGQYNYGRCEERKEQVAAELSRAEFLQYAIRLVYLLNKRYCPFYKWMHRGLWELPILGKEAAVLAEKTALGEGDTKDRIEALCDLLYEELERQLGIPRGSGFFLEYANSIHSFVTDEYLRRIGPWVES